MTSDTLSDYEALERRIRKLEDLTIYVGRQLDRLVRAVVLVSLLTILTFAVAMIALSG